MPVANEFRYTDSIETAKALLESIGKGSRIPTRLKRNSLTEAWFSNQLAWLLDTRGNHGLGSRFAEEFLKAIAKKRTTGEGYKHRAKFLRWGRRKVAGTLSTDFDLRNAAVFREFYLAHGTGGRKKGSAMLCDLVFLDLDTDDGILVAIENKLFTTNHPGQLERYYRIVEERYRRAKVLEYVYLTVLGDTPRTVKSATPHICERMWVCLSWKDDVLKILDSLRTQKRMTREVNEFARVLRWLKAACSETRREQVSNVVRGVFEGLAGAASECLEDELIRLSNGAQGNWEVKRRSKARTRILHSSKPKVPLYVGVLPNLSIVLYSDKKRRHRYDKLLIPFGSNADQIFNLTDLVARDIYPLHFGANYRKYLGPARRLRAVERDVRSGTRDFFEFVHNYRHELQLLVPLARLSAGHVLRDVDIQ